MALPISKETSQFDVNNYVMDVTNQISNARNGGRFNQSQILTYSDGSEWVFLGDKQQERFCGFLYLQNAIKEMGLKHFEAAPNKIAIHDRKIIYLSQYCGENRPSLFFDLGDDFPKELETVTSKIGFTDMTGFTNARLKDGKVFIFDTEKSSFDKSVHEKINAYTELHNQIRSSLEEHLKL